MKVKIIASAIIDWPDNDELDSLQRNNGQLAFERLQQAAESEHEETQFEIMVAEVVH